MVTEEVKPCGGMASLSLQGNRERRKRGHPVLNLSVNFKKGGGGQPGHEATIHPVGSHCIGSMFLMWGDGMQKWGPFACRLKQQHSPFLW